MAISIAIYGIYDCHDYGHLWPLSLPSVAIIIAIMANILIGIIIASMAISICHYGP